MGQFKVAPKENLRFFGGFVGYLGYDTVRFFEPIGGSLPDSVGSDDAHFVLPKFLAMIEAITDLPKPTTSAMITPLYSSMILNAWFTASS